MAKKRRPPLDDETHKTSGGNAVRPPSRRPSLSFVMAPVSLIACSAAPSIRTAHFSHIYLYLRPP